MTRDEANANAYFAVGRFMKLENVPLPVLWIAGEAFYTGRAMWPGLYGKWPDDWKNTALAYYAMTKEGGLESVPDDR